MDEVRVVLHLLTPRTFLHSIDIAGHDTTLQYTCVHCIILIQFQSNFNFSIVMELQDQGANQGWEFNDWLTSQTWLNRIRGKSVSTRKQVTNGSKKLDGRRYITVLKIINMFNCSFNSCNESFFAISIYYNDIVLQYNLVSLLQSSVSRVVLFDWSIYQSNFLTG